MAPSPKDKRKKVITLTAKGEKVEAEFKEIFKEVSATVKAGITPEEEKTVREVLAKIRANVGGEKE
jgi:DNA-binding MarR family transcriptional regulator